MHRVRRYLAMMAVTCTILFGVETIFNVPITQVRVEAHSGRTDAQGGHKDNKNKSGLGSYHYHCGGHPAHLHTDGVCPYAAPDPSAIETKSINTKTTTTNTTKISASKDDIKKIQEALNLLEYDCGTPDGILGKTTKKRIKEFQRDFGVVVDGVVNEKLMEMLGVK